MSTGNATPPEELNGISSEIPGPGLSTSGTPTSDPPDSEAAALASGVARLESLPSAEVARQKVEDLAPEVPCEPEPTEGTPSLASAVSDTGDVPGDAEEDSGWQLPFSLSDILGD